MVCTVLHLLLQFGPKFSVKATSTSCRSFPSTIFLGEFILDSFEESNRDLSSSRLNGNNTVSEAVVNEIVEGMAIAVVSELAARRREFLKALRGDSGEISLKFSVFSDDDRPPGNKTVNQGLLPHFSLSFSPSYMTHNHQMLRNRARQKHKPRKRERKREKKKRN
uniref:Uncharacterized protein n=1 Tax=Opuntia streptacantha TaxID=393608 RepID=A0A7C8YJQ1_OPUST